MDDETFERIPWEHLSGSPPKQPALSSKNALYALAGAVAVAAITASLTGGPDPLPPVTSVPTVAPTTTPAVIATSTTLFTEAALAAVPEARAEAAAWAEWATERYFTIDGSAESALAEVLPPGTFLPVPAPDQRVYVESVRTMSVVEEGADYRAVVVARLLGALGTEPYQRLSDRALAWTLRWEPEGWVLVDLPEEAPPPEIRAGAPFALGEVPEPVLSAGAQQGEVLGGALVGDLWRVVVAVTDQMGSQWPVVAWFAPDGSPAG